MTLFDPRPAVQWKNDPQAQRRATNRDFKGQNPQGGTAIHVWANSDLGAGKLEFLQGTQVVSTMDVEIKAGMNRFQWNMRGPAPAGGRGGRGRVRRRAVAAAVARCRRECRSSRAAADSAALARPAARWCSPGLTWSG